MVHCDGMLLPYGLAVYQSPQMDGTVIPVKLYRTLKKKPVIIRKPTRASGRQRTVFPTFAGMKQFAAWSHYTLEQIKFASNKNCKGFLQDGRIDAGLLVPELVDLLNRETELPKGFVSWKEFGESRRAKLADVELQEKKKSVMPIADAKKQNGEAWAFMDAKMEQLCNEAPPDYSGRPSVEIGIRLRSWKESTMREARGKFEKAA